ncbi:MAG TPA: CAP domain-containing protein [Solirubrobacteraceae bacterium]|nr:CAP domain-containing protein [Solirubrobacteraceae bacterium]
MTVSLPPTSAAIAGVLATPCQNTDLTPEPGDLEEVQEATLCLINQERARNNELPLAISAQLAQVAQQHSADMLSKDYFSHTTPTGETQLERVLASGYIPNSQVGYTIGENIAWGTGYLATPSSIVAAWIASPEHLANILTSGYRDTGLGVEPAAPPSLAGGQPGATYTQEFGVIQD